MRQPRETSASQSKYRSCLGAVGGLWSLERRYPARFIYLITASSATHLHLCGQRERPMVVPLCWGKCASVWERKLRGASGSWLTTQLAEKRKYAPITGQREIRWIDDERDPLTVCEPLGSSADSLTPVLEKGRIASIIARPSL